MNDYETVVDRLPVSPRYGERMTLAWLDAARYSDSSDGCIQLGSIERGGGRFAESESDGAERCLKQSGK